MSLFEKTVSALGYTLAQERAPDDPETFVPPYNDVVRFLEAETSRMADYLRIPLRCLTVLFDLAGFIHLGGLFHRQQPEARLRQVRAWRSSRLRPCRDFIRVYESLSVLALYSR